MSYGNFEVNLRAPDLFGNEAGEDENPELLSQYFVDKPEFQHFYSAHNPLSVVRARKGMGKSALLSKLAYDLRRDGHPFTLIIRSRGSDFASIGQDDALDPSALINAWQQRICELINARIGEGIAFAANETSINLVEAAELAGYKERNLLGCLIDRFRGKIGLERANALNPENLLRRALEQNEEQRFQVWVLVDDVDATFMNQPGNRLRVSTFFSACRKLASEYSGVLIRASVRSDVWTLVKRSDEALDKVEQYMIDIKWSEEEATKVLINKIHAYIQRQGVGSAETLLRPGKHDRDLMGMVFTSRWSWDKHYVSPERPIFVLSAGRPRWSAQLCKLAAAHADESNAKRIAEDDIDAVMPRFGQLRLDDLYREHGHQCPDLQIIVESFTAGPSRYTTTELFALLTDRIIRPRGVPEINGERPADASRVIARFLFQTGFIAGRRKAVDTPLTFVRFEERPDLLSTNINLDDGLVWEIQPQYRNVLRIFKRSDI